MEDDTKHTLSILDHSHFAFAHSFDILSDLSSVLVRTLRYSFELKFWPCVCVYCCGLVITYLPPPPSRSSQLVSEPFSSRKGLIARRDGS
jgi:hypothetical protein